jgi:hypothetical protein
MKSLSFLHFSCRASVDHHHRLGIVDVRRNHSVRNVKCDRNEKDRPCFIFQS